MTPSRDPRTSRLTDDERQEILDVGVTAAQPAAKPEQIAIDPDAAPRPAAECAACGHSRTEHRPDDRLPGEPTLCGFPIHGTFGEACCCDSHPANGGQTTIRLYDRIALLYVHAVTFDWWLGYNHDAGTRPIDLLRLGRFDELSDVVAAAEQKTWG